MNTLKICMSTSSRVPRPSANERAIFMLNTRCAGRRLVPNGSRGTVSAAKTDRIFHALGDATRRGIVTRVMPQPQNVSMLAGFYDMSFAAVQKHVAILERAALVRKERRDRE